MVGLSGRSLLWLMEHARRIGVSALFLALDPALPRKTLGRHRASIFHRHNDDRVIGDDYQSSDRSSALKSRVYR